MGENLPSWGLVLVRILVGGLLAVKAWMLLQSGAGEELVTGTRAAYAAAPGLVKGWGESVVLVHPWFFSKLALFGTLLGGSLTGRVTEIPWPTHAGSPSAVFPTRE